ncbi:hypothetical protein [Lysobacter sp. A289]
MGRSGVLRLAIAIAAAGLMAVLAVQLARVDAPLGAPAGPDRLVAAVDASAELPVNAAALARQALQDRPIDGRAYRVIAQVAMAEGDDAREATLFATSAQRWPRDRIAQVTLAERAFADADIAAGLTHLDALLRVAPALRAPLLANVVAFVDDTELRSGLVDRLAQDPPWRGALVRALLAEDTPVEPALTLLGELAERHSLTAGEIQARVSLLDRAGRPAEARDVWLQTMALDDRAAAGLVFDGGFEHPDVSGGYGWQANPPAGVAIGHDRSDPLEGENALAIVFDGRAVQFSHLRQPLALAPGRYRLQVGSNNAVPSDRAFVWRLTCVDAGNTRPLSELPLPRANGWQHSEVDFTVPPDCARQQLQLRHTARTLVEKRVRGVLQVDAVSIEATGITD